MLHAELKVVEGKQQGKTIPLNVKKFLIGREEDCQLRPNSELVSRHHCVFTTDDYTVRLRDLGSTNGTFVNGKRIQGQVMLENGDLVNIGKLAFQMVIGKPAAASQPAGAVRASSAEERRPIAIPISSAQGGSEDPSIHDTAAIDLNSLSLESDSAVLGSPEQGVSTSDTHLAGMPNPQTQEGDTTIIMPSQMPGGMQAGGLQPAALQQPGMPGYPPNPQYYQQPYPMQQPQYGQAPYGQPYPMPPQGYPMQQPYGMPYPQMQQPYPMQQPPMQQPQQFGGFPQPQAAPPIEAAPTPPPASGRPKLDAVTLPPPEDTGAPEPKPVDPNKPAAAAAAPSSTPSSAAADIIRLRSQRRPGAPPA